MNQVPAPDPAQLRARYPQVFERPASARLATPVVALLAFAIFMHAHIVSDFSVRNVFENSNTAKPMLYKVTGVWGSHEGSMMLWVLILTLFGALVATFGRPLPADREVICGMRDCALVLADGTTAVFRPDEPVQPVRVLDADYRPVPGARAPAQLADVRRELTWFVE